jgi:hypothetical protein
MTQRSAHGLRALLATEFAALFAVVCLVVGVTVLFRGRGER